MKNTQRTTRKLICCTAAALLLAVLCFALYRHFRTPDRITECIRASELVSEAGFGDTSVISMTNEASNVNDTLVISSENIKTNPCSDLSVPTYITKVDDTYFLVDCYHNQVIYNDNLSDPLYEWKVMTDDIDKGHTLASDGAVYLIDDTERHRILVFEKKDDVYVHTQTFNDIGNRPHYIIYDAPTDTFYACARLFCTIVSQRAESASKSGSCSARCSSSQRT